jgi:hypothetical protein
MRKNSEPHHCPVSVEGPLECVGIGNSLLSVRPGSHTLVAIGCHTVPCRRLQVTHGFLDNPTSQGSSTPPQRRICRDPARQTFFRRAIGQHDSLHLNHRCQGGGLLSASKTGLILESAQAEGALRGPARSPAPAARRISCDVCLHEKSQDGDQWT